MKVAANIWAGHEAPFPSVSITASTNLSRIGEGDRQATRQVALGLLLDLVDDRRKPAHAGVVVLVDV